MIAPPISIVIDVSKGGNTCASCVMRHEGINVRDVEASGRIAEGLGGGEGTMITTKHAQCATEITEKRGSRVDVQRTKGI
jgi:hypothetical protein